MSVVMKVEGTRVQCPTCGNDNPRYIESLGSADLPGTDPEMMTFKCVKRDKNCGLKCNTIFYVAPPVKGKDN